MREYLQGVNLDRASPRFSIKLRWRPEKSNDIPGPGAYGTLRLPALEKLLELKDSGMNSRESKSSIDQAAAVAILEQALAIEKRKSLNEKE